VAGLGADYRPPIDDPGTGGDPTGRGAPGLDTFRFKYATWGLAVKRDIERAWKVPEYGISSLSIVRFVVLPDGKIRGLELEKSSGLASLDQAATNAITNAAPFRPFPPRMREENPGGIDITVNFYYREGRGVLHWE
jgi:TonB family protein